LQSRQVFHVVVVVVALTVDSEAYGVRT
jgi:hypothetical protein